MAKAAALVITGISIALLVIYGADAAVGMDDLDKQGFLDMDHMTRGLGLGGPAMVLPLIAYFISRNDSSKVLGGMILVAGILIIIGGVTVIGMADLSEANETARNPFMETVPLLVEIQNYWYLLAAVLIGGQIGNFLNLKIFPVRLLALLTGVLVLFVAFRMGMLFL